MDESALRWLILAGNGLVFVALWLGALHVSARIGGWRELARAYPPLGIPGSGLGETFRFRSIGLRARTHYGACVTLVAGLASLRVSLMRPFGVGHPPFEVPWDDITTEPKRAFLVPQVSLRCARVPHVPIRMQRPLAEALARASGGRLQLPETQAGRPSPEAERPSRRASGW